MNSLYLIAAILAGVVFPLYAIWGGRNLKQMLREDPSMKTPMFRATAIELIVLSLVCLLPFWINHTSLADIGLAFTMNPYMVIGLLAITFLVLWLLWHMKISPEMAETIKSQYVEVEHIMPVTRSEYKLTVFVSYVAGICEEIVYRGFLLWFLSLHMPLIPAILLANIPFALAHLSSTGLKNSMMSFLLALVFTAAFLLTKSLWLPILLHILVDLYSMTIYYRGTRLRAESNGNET